MYTTWLIYLWRFLVHGSRFQMQGRVFDSKWVLSCREYMYARPSYCIRFHHLLGFYQPALEQNTAFLFELQMQTILLYEVEERVGFVCCCFSLVNPVPSRYWTMEWGHEYLVHLVCGYESNQGHVYWIHIHFFTQQVHVPIQQFLKCSSFAPPYMSLNINRYVKDRLFNIIQNKLLQCKRIVWHYTAKV